MGLQAAVSFTLVLILCFTETEQNIRSKRQISVEQPRIVTQNGNLIFQTGANHNISFKSISGGSVNIDGENVKTLAQTVRDNKQAIDQLKTSPTSIPTNVESRLANVEQRLNNLQPTGAVQTQLTSLSTRITSLESNVPSNVNSRLQQVENSLNNLVPTGQVQTTLTNIQTRLNTIESRVDALQNGNSGNTGGLETRSPSGSSSRRRPPRYFRRLRRQVRTLENQVTHLTQLLTRDECQSNPCRNGGSCVDRYNGYICRCTSGWQGTNCDTDVNECGVYSGTSLGCQNGATCVNTIGSFRCDCTANWHGIRCTEQHDDCTGASNQELCGHGTCVNSDRIQPGQPKYTCICDEGWTKQGSDPACVVDKDECTESGSPCSTDPPVACINVPGSFYCGLCPAGFTGNGYSCLDINECEVNNGGCSLSPRVDCINTRGSRQCGPCPQGYQGNGIVCTWVGVCGGADNGGCHPQATCTEAPNVVGRTCTCRPGYVGNGIGPNGCIAQGSSEGPCQSNPCQNGAACQITGSSYQCTCQAGYTGTNCQTNINECSSTPCQNGGTCTDRVNGYTCQCTDAYTGANCEQEQQSCGGTLTGETGSFRFPRVEGTTYPHGANCAWRIESTPGKIVSATFPQFHIEYHPNCAYDFLQIHDGPSASAHKIGTYCGTDPPNGGRVNTTQHKMYIWFYSDVSVAADGFQVNWISANHTCGGDIVGQDHGVVSSPGFPGNYPHNVMCIWRVTVSPGNNIQFAFSAFALENHVNCSYDYLKVYDGNSDSAPELGRYCNNTGILPAPLQTTSPDAYIVFHSDGSMSAQGFQMTFHAVSAGPQCGGTLSDSDGVIQSPNFPQPYNHDASCVWVITVSAGDTITLTFLTMDLEGYSTCNYDYVEVRDGADENALLFNRYCGTTVPSPITSSGNSLYIRFRSDQSVTGQGFRATYTTACGGTYTAPEGTIQSPSFPNPYPHSKTCNYIISQPVGRRVTLTFTSLNIESSATCSYDYVEVHDGNTELSPSLGKFCGSEIPSSVRTSQNMMFVRFISDGSINNQGFQATYSSDEEGCGQILTSPSGSITSPGHPNSYPNGVNCTWRIESTPGLIIRLTFSTFTLESHTNCQYDYVAVYDGPSADQASSLGRYCGSTVPPTLTSSDNYMTLLFVSDSSIAHEGFSASYTSLNASTLCGSDLTGSNGLITSPNYPNNYPHNRQCTWTITAPRGNQILLNVTDFQMESHRNCAYDYLEIRNGRYADSPLIGKYCGTNIDNDILSHSNNLYLKFVTDASYAAKGFKIAYDTTTTGCGGDLTSPTGSFVSPGFPGPYSHNAECFWTISTSRSSRIELSFEAFELEHHSECNFDYLEIRDGSASGRVLATYCGNQIPDPLTSLSNRLWIKFRTDYSMAGNGFKAVYSTNCNVRLNSYRGVIESPNFPQPYPHNRNCTWIIDTTLGNTINVAFSHFDIESHSQCQFDYLEIRDGELATSPLLSKYCGSQLPPPLNSTGEMMWIKFASDFSVAQNGFRLEWATNGCGGYLTQATGSFTSPNYPQNYPHRRECEWHISVATGYSVELTIQDFDLETHSACAYDVLEIFGGTDNSSPLLARICHKQTKPQVLTSTGNNMYIRFKSDISVSGKGFRATYRALTGGCGGNFSTPSGSIFSKNYPSKYPHNTDCTWLITVAEGRSVAFTFEDFDVEGSSGCIYDYVALYDGPNQNASEIMRHCSNELPSPPMYRSTGNQMFVRMLTDSSISARGFKANYITGCGGILSGEEDGVITSPNYPQKYDVSSNCSWLIYSDHSDDKIILTFTHMDLELHEMCNHDAVKVYDGNDDQASLIGSYCGNTVPPPLTSQGSAMFVTFTSDASIQQSGFRATYTKSVSSCGGDFTAERGTFTSPGYPNEYPHNTECVWTIRTSYGNRVMVSFSMFILEAHDNCNYDYLELREGDVNGQLIGRYCGNNIPNNLTSANGIWMKFRSDESSTSQGFVAQYSSVYGGEVSGSSGQIASPMYPNQYPHNSDYSWTIIVDVGMRIRIVFSVLDMEGSSSCFYDYVRFLDGPDSNSPTLNSFCGTNIPPPFISSTNVLVVQFHSDFSSTGHGFLFRWEATTQMMPTTGPTTPSTTPIPGCGGYLGASPVLNTIVSPGYPDEYSNNLNCLWQITTLPGNRVWVNITDINIEGHSSCNYDKLSFYDNMYGQGAPTAFFCGRNRNPEPLLSSSNEMSIKLETDYSVTRPGFSLDYRQECGGMMRMDRGVIMSPNYPSPYNNNANCSWTIAVTISRTIRVTFNSTFNIDGTIGACSGDYVQLLNGGNTASPPLGPGSDGRYCGNTAPVAMETNSNLLYVNFVSDGTASAPGFQMHFQEIHVACGGQIQLTNQESSSTFMSPNYPQNYPHNVDCVWIISAPAGESVQLEFDENFNIEVHGSCNYDFIELRSGGTSNAPLIGRYCGTSRPGTIKSTGNVMYARFRTDNSVPRVGFRATVQLARCGGTIIGSSGLITSPNFPSNYDSNQDCEWYIRAPVGHFLRLTYDTFNLENNYNCTLADYVDIREINSTGPLLDRRCGSGPTSPLMTSDSFAYIRFRSNAAINSQGFRLRFQASVEACGGDLTTDVGSFTSPNFPGQYPHGRICIWRIRVQPGRRVTLSFGAFNLENHANCVYDYVAVYNGILDDSPRIDRYCGSNPPTMVESRSNTMKVEFRTDGSISNGGFMANYTSRNEQTCGASIIGGTGSLGNITSPGYGVSNYSNSDECIWTLANRNTVNASFYLKHINFLVESHRSCMYDFLEIREGNNENGDLVGKYCGNTTRPPMLISASPNIYIRWKTDSSIVDLGFWLAYGITDCGGVLTQDNGVITSPNFPNNYNHSDACAWQIIAPEGYQIKVDFEFFHIENHPSCQYDLVDILNGPLPTSPSVGPFCGYSMPALLNTTLVSQSNSIRVIFKTDVSVNANGFKLRYSFSTGGCSTTYHSNNGVIKTPNYDSSPGDYPHNAECLWDINVEDGYQIILTFQPPFDLEVHGECAFDYVEVNDVYSNGTFKQLGRWCGLETPPVLRSTGSRMVVKFRSDATTRGHGFAANWTVGCGGIFTDENGDFVSPGYPNNYGNNLRCNYTIAADPQRYIVLEFDSIIFRIEDSPNCMHDYVQVFSGNDTSGPRLGRFCGNTIPQPVSSLGTMYIQFNTDGSLVDKGFRARYRTSACGGVFTNSEDVIHTPTHPVNYHHNANCTWNITVEENRIVALRFLSFDLEAHSQCRYDYVEVFDGQLFSSPSLGKFCGNVIPNILRSTGNSMLINFVTDISVSRTGFSAAYRTTYGINQGCGGVLNTTSGSLKAVDSDNDGQYERALDCRWTILVGDNKIVRLTITGMDIEAHSRCRYDYILVHDGLSEDDPIIGRYCGNQAPPVIKSTSNVLYVRFVSDYSVSGAGFNATFVQEDALCGGAFIASDSVQTITSPRYPQPAVQNLRCRWTIAAPEDNQQVRLITNNLNLIADNNCTDEYIEFRDSPMGWVGRSIHYCGTNVPGPFDSAGKSVQINYAVMAASGSSGFSLTYQIASCNRTISGSSGQIFSPGWPGRYSSNSNCQIRVSGPTGTYISLYFNSFFIEPHSSCRYDFLEIRNGSDSTSPVISKLCGNYLPDPIFATGNELWMNLVTDTSVTHPGYDITWTATPQGIGCGGDITGINGSLTSPGYPGNYTERHSCRWTIRVPNRRIVTVQIRNMNILGSVDCNRGYVEIFNGNTDSAPSFGRYCGSDLPPPLVAMGNTVLVKFISDGLHSAPGFRITFTS